MRLLLWVRRHGSGLLPEMSMSELYPVIQDPGSLSRNSSALTARISADRTDFPALDLAKVPEVTRSVKSQPLITLALDHVTGNYFVGDFLTSLQVALEGQAGVTLLCLRSQRQPSLLWLLCQQWW